MRTKDQILLENAYVKVLEGYNDSYDDSHDDRPDPADFYEDPRPHKVHIEDQVSIPAEDVVYNTKGELKFLPPTAIIGGEYFLEAEVYVNFSVTPYEKPSMDSPGGGGDFEDFEFEFENVKVIKVQPDGNTLTQITPQNVGEEKYQKILNQLLKLAEEYAKEETIKEVRF